MELPKMTDEWLIDTFNKANQLASMRCEGKDDEAWKRTLLRGFANRVLLMYGNHRANEDASAALDVPFTD